MSWSPGDDTDWRPNRVPSGLCKCDGCNTAPWYDDEEDPTPQEQWEVTMPKDMP